MNAITAYFNNSSINPLQLIKIVVYTLLLINFGFYLHLDWSMAQHTLGPNSTWFDWTTAYNTSIDEAAWFVLLFLFELETYVLSDEAFTRARVMLMHGVRLLCYIFIFHTVIAYGNATYELHQINAIEGVTDLCELSGIILYLQSGIYRTRQ